jgi:cobalt-zinc-cadmium efflux system protein
MMAVAGVGIVVNAATALLFMRGRETDLNIRGAFFAYGGRCLGVGRGRSGRCADPVDALELAGPGGQLGDWCHHSLGTWGLFKESLHLLFDGVPSSVDPVAVRQCLEGLPGVSAVSDLHIWAMGTSHIALTAHLVMPHGGGGDDFLAMASEKLHNDFEIGHVTLQVATQVLATPCGV